MTTTYDVPRYQVTRATDSPQAGWVIEGGYTDGLALPPDLPELVVQAIAAYVEAEVDAAHPTAS